METSKANNNRAFTLIEMMVVVGIVIVITGLSFAGYKSGQSQYALQISAQELASNLRRAQSMALSTVTQNGQAPAGGYGIYFNKATTDNSYILFSDTKDTDFSNGYAYDVADQPTDMVELKSGVKINIISITQKGIISPFSSAYIIFTPPDPIITIGHERGNSADQLSITINLNNAPTQTKTITINKFGKIDIK